MMPRQLICGLFAPHWAGCRWREGVC